MYINYELLLYRNFNTIICNYGSIIRARLQMKFALAFLLCSYVAETCLPPHVYELEFDNEYDCLVTGYEESLKKIQEIGEIDVNEHRMYIKFGCYELEPENQET